MQITTTQEDFERQLTLLSLPFGKGPLFPVVALEIEGGVARTIAKTEGNSSFMQAKLPMTCDEDGQVVLDTIELMKFLKLFPKGDLNLEVGLKQEGTINIIGKSKRAKVSTLAEAPPSPKMRPTIVDGIVQYKSGPATTIVKMHTGILSALVADAQVVQTGYFPLHFGEDESYASLGSDEAKKNSIITDLDVKVKGPDIELTIGQDFIHLFSNLDGQVQLQLREDHPLAVFYKPTKKEAYFYLLSPRKE